MTGNDETAALATALQNRLGYLFGGPVVIQDFEPVTTGASRDIWSLTAQLRDGTTKALILRRDPPAAPRPEQMAREASVLKAAMVAGVPVPGVVDHGDGSNGVGSPYVVMDRLEGQTIPRKILRDAEWASARDGLAKSLGGILARIHQIPADSVDRIEDVDAVSALEDEYRASGAPSPAFEIAWRWLHENRPARGKRTVVHGDFRNGNLIIDRDGVAGVLDWELVHVGEALEDLGWVCVKAWRFGSAEPVGGFGSREELLDGYAEVAGERPEPTTLLWWEVYGTVRWGVICRRQAARHLSGSEPSLELAMIGRRFSENEHDVMLALGLTCPHEVVDPIKATVIEPDPLFHGPTAGQLLQVISDYLAGRSQSTGNSPAYLDRVANNAISIIRRELLVGDGLRRRHADLLGAIGLNSESDLALAIRDGSIDPHDDAVMEAVRCGVDARLQIDNPRYLSLPG